VHTTLKQVRWSDTADGDLRCDCGKLLARVLRAVIELKCPRCKRVVLVVGGRRYEPTDAPACPSCHGP
jgi:phage FluMu protein Com